MYYIQIYSNQPATWLVVLTYLGVVVTVVNHKVQPVSLDSTKGTNGTRRLWQLTVVRLNGWARFWEFAGLGKQIKYFLEYNTNKSCFSSIKKNNRWAIFTCYELKGNKNWPWIGSLPFIYHMIFSAIHLTFWLITKVRGKLQNFTLSEKWNTVAKSLLISSNEPSTMYSLSNQYIHVHRNNISFLQLSPEIGC